jgi:hypothetical protein
MFHTGWLEQHAMKHGTPGVTGVLPACRQSTEANGSKNNTEADADTAVKRGGSATGHEVSWKVSGSFLIFSRSPE